MPPKVEKPRTVRCLGNVDSARLAALAARVSDETWASEDKDKENNFEVFHHTQHVIFRFISANRDPEVHYANPAWEIWQPLLMPVMQQAIAPYGFRKPMFPKAMLARLRAGHIIDPHYDGAGSNLRVHKIHVPLITNPDALFQVNDDQFHLEPGKAYEVNNIVSHGASNMGTEDRIHFIFEVYEGDYALIDSDKDDEATAGA